MKACLVLMLVGMAMAYPTGEAPILRAVSDNNNEGGYSFAFESANGIQQHESGDVKVVPGSPELGLVKSGSYSWISPEGITFRVSYIADENGFRATGAHLPTPPPVPQAILESLAVIRAAEEHSASASQSATLSGNYARY